MNGSAYSDWCEKEEDYLKEFEAEAEAKIAGYYAKATLEGRICKVCGFASDKVGWCTVCERRNASKRGLENLKTK